ncbi:MAG TPA: hypothetical protein VFA19_03700 [Gaiellaceae bacterium]|nr:hypothetical protein [Gaiellaceae bacterium]
MLHLTVGSFVALLLAGAAVLAVWTVTRFGRLGPRTLGGAMLHELAAMMLVAALPNLAEATAAAAFPGARLVIAFGLVLPVFTYLFLASLWFVRLLVDLFGGLY